VTDAVIQKEENRFYQYLVSMVDFLTEFRNNLPTELYTVADSIYGPGIASFLVNEIGFIPKGIYITDGVPDNYENLVRTAVMERDEILAGLLTFETDGGLIQQDIRKKLGKSRKALFLGSGWEKFLAQETHNLHAFISMPLPETVIVNKTFAGYDGGLALIEEIYSNLFSTKTTTSRTQFITGE
jgi:nitrogenase molybdenum-iron protein beta chain